MAKGKFEKWLSEDGILRIHGWARDGLTDVEIAQRIGIATSTLYEWMKRFPEISEAVKKDKEIADRKVEGALFNKTQGYTVQLQKTFKVREAFFDAITGKRVRESERLETGVDEVHIPADTTAQIFWLKNRKPDTWRDKSAVEVTGEIKNPFAGLSTGELRKMIDGG